MTLSRGSALVVDDHELFRLALSEILRHHLRFERVFGAGSVEEAMQVLDREVDISLATIDLCLPGLEDIGAIGLIAETYPNVCLTVVSGSATWSEALECIKAGARAFVPKALSADEIASALERAVLGETYLPPQDRHRGTTFMPDSWRRPVREAPLTARQAEVYALLQEGLSNKLIARHLGLSENTVKVHVFAICRILGVHDRREAAKLKKS